MLDTAFRSFIPAAEACLARSREVIARLAKIGSFEGETPAGAGTAETEAGSAVAAVPFGALIDMEVERARLAREADALENETGRIEKKHVNPRFVERAPEDVVEEQKARREEARARRERISRALGDLDV